MAERTFHLAVNTEAPDGTSVTIHDGGPYPLVAVTRTSPRRALAEAFDQLADALERTDAVESESHAVAPCSVGARSELASVLMASVPPRGAPGCTCGTAPFAPPEPAEDCPFHSATVAATPAGGAC